ncbi:3-hydroxyacyl-CoA dehydrogenase family protein [Streptomyces sp. B21-083]|uniref:3-hydroxyacyl-CoA dehydrogenase family protein n=1 Tax=Streptomyces sp. B21-083 TaxID=3039410 RepID=UPI003FA6C0A6
MSDLHCPARPVRPVTASAAFDGRDASINIMRGSFAVRMVESGGARPEGIDQGMEQGCAHPVGPLCLLDRIGLDAAQAIAESMRQAFEEPLYAPPALLCRMATAGHLGAVRAGGLLRARQLINTSNY